MAAYVFDKSAVEVDLPGLPATVSVQDIPSCVTFSLVNLRLGYCRFT